VGPTPGLSVGYKTVKFPGRELPLGSFPFSSGPFPYILDPMSLTTFQDNPLYIGFLFGLFISFFTWSVLDYLSKARQRQRALQDLAQGMGFCYFPTKREFEKEGLRLPGVLDPSRRLKTLFGLAQSWDCQNILMGVKGGRETLYVERLYGDMSETRALYRKPGGALPYFELVPLRLFDKFHRLLELEIGELFHRTRMTQIELNGLGEFRRPRHHLWGVAGHEGDYANLFSRDLLEYLLQFPNWRMKGMGEWVMIFEENIRVAPEKMAGFTDETAKAASLIFTAQDLPLGGTTPSGPGPEEERRTHSLPFRTIVPQT
jgi:hypothetical protein